MAEINTWVTMVFLVQFIAHQMIGVLLGIRWRFDGWGILSGFLLASAEYLIFRNFWLAISAQLVSGGV